MASDWREIENDREKYAAYLCSREWGLLKEAVRERAGGKCERCKILPIDATHHLTYERKYAEPLEDLQGICTPCHRFIHGKEDFDPKLHSDVLAYLVGCKEAGRLAVPTMIATGHYGPTYFDDELAAKMIAIDLLHQEELRVQRLDVILDERSCAALYGLSIAIGNLAEEFERLIGLPFSYLNWSAAEIRTPYNEYESAAKLAGAEIFNDLNVVRPRGSEYEDD